MNDKLTQPRLFYQLQFTLITIVEQQDFAEATAVSCVWCWLVLLRD